MSIAFEVETGGGGAQIRIVGVGGAGGNALNTMINNGMSGVEFIATNTDAQALRMSLAPHRIQLGGELTKGLGAGADPEVGREATRETEVELRDHLSSADMVFVTAGMGGGTGTGGAPVIAQLAREIGALTVGVVTKPFLFEGRRRGRKAEEGVRELKEHVDTLICIPNQRLLALSDRNLTLPEAFRKADEVLLQAVQGISKTITTQGLVNLDFADVRTIMADMGMAVMGTASATGPTRAEDAARRAIASPLLEDFSINGARGVLVNVTGGKGLGIQEVNDAVALIEEVADEEAEVIFGAVIDESMDEEITVTVIITGFGDSDEAKPGWSRKLGMPHGVNGRNGHRARNGNGNGHANGRNGHGPGKSAPKVDVETLEEPAFVRRGHAGRTNGAAVVVQNKPDGDVGTEIPTFIRRRAT